MAETKFRKDMELELQIVDMGAGCEGIGKSDGAVFFVKDAVIGDRVRVKIMKMKKNFGYARLMEVLEPSPYRVKPRCASYRQCGGCQIQALDYRKQLEFKEHKVRDNLRRIGGFSLADGDGEAGQGEALAHPILGMDEPYFYRNKAQFPIGTDKNGRIVAGFYAAHTHNIIPNRKCLLGADVNEAVLDAVISYMEERRVPAYDEATGKGLVRHVLIRFGFVTKEVMACLVVNGRSLPHAEDLVRRLRKIEGMTCVMLNVNKKNTNAILGEESISLWGQNFITDYIGDVKYQISPLSFYQVNPAQTKKLYECALDFAGLTGTETVWDLYCGIGTISLFLARKARYVYGVEVSEAAVADARNNARINGIGNVEFFAGKAEEVLPDFYEKNRAREEKGEKGEAVAGEEEEAVGGEGREWKGGESAGIGEEKRKDPGGSGQRPDGDMLRPDVIVVDPPRKGCDQKCLETILKMRPERVVYVSCDPATLARDLKFLCREAYALREVQTVDMFPQTGHVETVCLMSRVEGK